MKISLRYSIPIALLVFTIALSVWNLKSNGAIVIKNVEKDLKLKLTFAMTLLQGDIEDSFQKNNKENIHQKIAIFGSLNNIKSLFLIDNEGVIISSTRLASIDLNIRGFLSKKDKGYITRQIEEVESSFAGKVFTSFDKNSIWGLYPVQISFKEGYIHPTKTGALISEVDMIAPKHSALSLIEDQTLKFFLFPITLVIALGIFIHFRLTKRIHGLVIATESFSSGDYNPEINVKGYDEITLLAKTFAKMAKNRILAKKKLQQSEENYRRLFSQLSSIVEGTSSKDSKQFFNLLTQHLAESLNMRYAFVGEIADKDMNLVNTISVWADNGRADNFSYSLAGTPCENVIGQSLCCYPSDIQKKFPQDKLLEEMNVQGYLGIPLFNSEKKPIGILSVMHDQPIADEENAKIILSIFAKQAESELERNNTDDKLKQSRNMLQLIVDSIPQGIFWKDKESRYIGCNLRTTKDAGLASPKDIIGKDDFSLPWKKYADLYRKDDLEIMNSGRAKLNFEEPLDLQSDAEFLVKTNKVPLSDADGNITGLLGIYEDITKQKREEEELKRYRLHLEELVDERTKEIQLAKDALEASQITYSNLLSNLRGMVYRCKNDKDWTAEFVSKGALELTGYQPEDFLKKEKISFIEITHKNDRERIWNEVQEAIEKKSPYVLHYKIITAEGREKWVWEQGRGIYSANNELLALEGYVTDITQQMEAEQRIKESQLKIVHMEKLTALGKLTGSIAHEFNNPLESKAFWKFSKGLIWIRKRQGLPHWEVKSAIVWQQ